MPHLGAPKRIAISPGLSVKSTPRMTERPVVGRVSEELRPTARQRSFSAEEMPCRDVGSGNRLVTPLKISVGSVMLGRKRCCRQVQREKSPAQNCGAETVSDDLCVVWRGVFGKENAGAGELGGGA